MLWTVLKSKCSRALTYKKKLLFFPPASAVVGIKSVQSVCVCGMWDRVDSDNILDEFEGQGQGCHAGKRDFGVSDGLTCTDSFCHDI